MIRHRVRALVVGLCFLSGGQVCPLAAKEPKQTPKNTISIQLAAPVKPQTFSRPVTFYVVDVIDRTGDPDPMLVYRTSVRLLWREFGQAVFLDREPKSIVRQALEDSLRAAGMLARDEASAEYLLAVYLFRFDVASSAAGLYSRVELNVAMKNPKTGNSEQVSGLGAAVEGREPSPFAEPRYVRAVLTDALEAALRNFLRSTKLPQALETLSVPAPTGPAACAPPTS